MLFRSLLGDALHALAVGRQIRQIFAYREEVLERRFMPRGGPASGEERRPAEFAFGLAEA